MVLDTFVYTEPEQRRDVFLSVASHELRAPLTVLKLQTQHLHQLLTRQGLSEYVAILAQMEAQIRKLERLNADALNISNMPRGGLAYVEESVDLSQVLYETAEMMQRMHPTHRIVVRVAATTSLVGDKDRLGQVSSTCSVMRSSIPPVPGRSKWISVLLQRQSQSACVTTGSVFRRNSASASLSLSIEPLMRARRRFPAMGSGYVLPRRSSSIMEGPSRWKVPWEKDRRFT